MLQYFLTIISETVRILADTSIYLLFGFLIAGLLHAYFPSDKIKRFFGKDDLGSVFNASLFGVPLPLCSCSVLPMAVEMRKSGASRGSVFSFLISTPETSVPSVGISFALLDPLMTVFRPVAAFITALLTGLGINLIDRKAGDQDVSGTAEETAPGGEAPSCSTKSGVQPGGETSHYAKFRTAVSYSFGHLLDDMAPWLAIGIIAAGIISASIPEGFFSGYLGSGILPMLIMLVIGIPLYICATGSTPIAAALILKGLSPGAAFVFLLVGPATNIGSLIVLSKYFPRRVIVFYLASLAVLSLILGGLLNAFYSYFNLSVSATLGKGATLIPEWMKIGAMLMLAVLLHRSLKKSGQYSKAFAWLRAKTGWSGKKLARFAAIVIALVYLSDGFFVVPAGNTGMIVVFGDVVKENLEPGLYYRPPVPIGKTTLVETDKVRTLEIGFRRLGIEQASRYTPTSAYIPTVGEKLDKLVTRDRPEESELLAGDENLIDLDATVHYRIQDAYQSVYRIEDIEKVLRELVTYHILEEIATRQVPDQLTETRAEFEDNVHRGLQSTLAELGIGVEVCGVNLIYSHAPDVVHPAYRDVASAMEDKYRLINLAEADSISNVAQARAKASRKLNVAKGDSAQTVSRATGESNRLTAVSSANRIRRQDQYFRMNVEAAESTLVNIEKILSLTENGEGLDLIFIPKSLGTATDLTPQVLEQLRSKSSP